MELKLELILKPKIEIVINKMPTEYEDHLSRELNEIKKLLELLEED